MGADAEVYLFDHDRFTAEVVPSLRALLLKGASSSGLGDILRSARDGAAAMVERHDHPTNHKILAFLDRLTDGLGVDLEHHCSLLRPDLSPLRPLHLIKRSLGEWPDRRCRHDGCPEAARCPLHDEDGLGAEVLLVNVLHRAFGRCLGPSAFVGRSVNFTTWLLWLEDMGLVVEGAPDTELTSGLRRLGVRGFHIGYRWANSDGVHGWLAAAEAAELAEHMARLPLPEVAPTVEAIAATLTSFPDGSRRYHIEGWDRSSMLLAFVRAMAGLARDQGLGLLLGLDLVCT